MHALRSLGVLLVLAVLSFGAQCQDPTTAGPFVRALLEDVPSGAERAVVYSFLDGKLANQVLSIPLTRQASFSFGLRLPAGSTGELRISAGVFSPEGCLLSSRTEALKLASGDELLGVSLRLRPIGITPLCSTEGAMLIAAEPAQISTAGRNLQRQAVPLRLYGWGFRPGTAVLIGGRPQMGVRVVSAEEILIEQPDTSLPLGPVRITLRDTDQPEISRDGLLEVFVEPIGLHLRQTVTGSPTDPLLDVGVGDLNADRRDDLVLLDARGVLSIYHNVDGRLELVQKLPLALQGLDSTSIGSITTGDVNGDGIAEVVVTSTGGTVLVQRQGDGSYGLLRSLPELRAHDVVLAPMLSSTSLDLVLAGDEITIHRNPGNGLFTDTPAARFAAPSESIQAADLNNDGLPDVLAATAAGEVLVLSLKDGVLSSWFQLPVRSGCPSWPARVIAADLNNDQKPDIVTNGSSQLLLRRSDGFAARYINGVAPCFGGVGLAVADLNQDRIQDILWILGSSTVVLPGTVGGMSSEMLSGISILSSASLFAPNGPRHLPLIDLVGDGKRAIVTGINVVAGAASP